MSVVIAFTQADAVGWLCFAFGAAVMAAGVTVGLRTSFTQAPQRAAVAEAKLQEAQMRIDEVRDQLEATRSAMAAPNLEAATDPTMRVSAAVGEAGVSAEAASSALEQVQGIVSALPQDLRFAGMLVLVGTVLISVATIQFGGTSLF